MERRKRKTYEEGDKNMIAEVDSETLKNMQKNIEKEDKPMEINEFYSKLIKEATKDPEFSKLAKIPEEEITPEDFQRAVQLGVKAGINVFEQKKTIRRAEPRMAFKVLREQPVTIMGLLHQHLQLMEKFLDILESEKEQPKENPCFQEDTFPYAPMHFSGVPPATILA